MKAKKILFPTDFSHAGDAALALATSLARDMSATLVILHVEEPPPAYGGGMYYGLPDPSTQELERMLREIKPADENVPFEHHLITGDPASGVVRFAETHDVELIVMGTHGRTGFSRLLLGSVAEEVVRRAPCPVLSLKQPTQQKAET